MAGTPDTKRVRGAAPAGASRELEISRVERLEDLEGDWARLAEPTGHPFAAWEWSLGWWRQMGEGRELFTFACREEGGGVVAILPLYVAKSGPLRLARFIGDGDLRSPICAPENRAAAAAAMREAIAASGASASLLLAERLPGEAGWADAIGGRLLATHPDPVLPFEGRGWEELLAARSRNFRQQVRRRERRLVEEHGLGFRLSDPARLDADLEQLFRLHGERWGEESSGVFAGARGDFQREFAAAAQRRGWLRLWIAEIEGAAVAAWYGWRFAGSEWYYQAGRDLKYDDLSLGFVLLAHSVRAACEDGAESYRFLDGAEPYKWRFASEDLSAESRLLSCGARGGAAAWAVARAAQMPGPVRRRILRGMG